MISPVRKVFIIAFAVALAACGAPHPPHCRQVPRASRQPAAELIAEARRSWIILRQHDDTEARRRYNTAVAKLFDQLRCPQRPWDQAAAVMGTRLAKHGKDDADLSHIEVLFPATDVDTDDIGKRQCSAGIGVPLVGWRPQPREGSKRSEFMPPTGDPSTVTAVLNFDHGTPEWSFAAPLTNPDTIIGQRKAALAADWSASQAFYWRMSRLNELTVQNVILPGRFQEETGLYFGQPYDPDRIPVIFVHGLKSSPATFRKMMNQLSGQEWFRKNYQVWFFNYPTGNPWMVTAARFRKYMREAEKFAIAHGDRGNLKKSVVVAHSMGGLVTRASLSDPKHAFYDCYFKKPVSQLNMTAKSREIIQEGLLYQPVDFPDRVVFMAVPHQGSPLADRFLSTLVARIIRLPKTLTIDLLDITLNNASALVLNGKKETRLPTSIDSLSPEDPSIRALQRTRMNPRIHCNSIIGDRGKGDSPNSSDGVVPYWSSHIAPVESEKVVPGWHSVPKNQDAINEVERILKAHTRAHP